jgi:hypothetical protein
VGTSQWAKIISNNLFYYQILKAVVLEQSSWTSEILRLLKLTLYFKCSREYEVMLKQIVTAGVKAIRKQGRPRGRWADEGEEDLKVNGNQKLVRSGQRAERM